MLYLLILDLIDSYSFLNVFKYLTVRTGLAVFTSLLVVFLIGNPFINFFSTKQILSPIREDGPDEHIIKKIGTPTMGGLLIFFSVVVSTILCAEPNIYVVAALVTYSLLTIVGFTDDYLKISKKNSKGLSGRYKLLGQLLTIGVLVFMILGP